ncbi:MAG: gamma carbonic anhydrase family protein [Candidatus Kapaibacterium sp.]
MKFESGNSGSIITYKGITPKIHLSCFICEGVRIIGDVEIGEDSSIWYNVVIRGDVHYIRIGKRCNIQDLAMLHVTNGRFPLNLGDEVSIAHSAAIHGCTIEDKALIGIGAKVLDGATVGEASLIGAGAVVREGFSVPPGTLAAGVPARIIRDLTPQELERVTSTAEHYVDYVKDYRNSLNNQEKYI